MECFWVVWCETAGRPTVKHFSFDSAHREAERLALRDPGCKFHVLQSIETAEHQAVRWTNHDQIPF